MAELCRKYGVGRPHGLCVGEAVSRREPRRARGRGEIATAADQSARYLSRGGGSRRASPQAHAAARTEKAAQAVVAQYAEIEWPSTSSIGNMRRRGLRRRSN